MLQTILFGLISGLIGTITMTIGQYIEIGITRRKPSLTPAIIISKVFGFNLENFKERNKWRLNNLVHWSYGLLWGAVLGIVYSFFLLGFTSAVVVYFLIFWIQGLIVVPSFGIAPPVWKWETKWIVLDGLFHFIYAVAAAAIYTFLIA